MEDKCPKCGAMATTIVNWISGNPTFDFACGTEQLPGGLVRGDECYEAEIATLREQLVTSERTSMFRSEHADDLSERLNSAEELLWGAVKLFQNLYIDISFAKEAIEPGLVELGTLLTNLKQIQTFLTTPEVVKVMEEE